ncbi:POTRA domain-containing protein [uncultured Methylophaga sp.]|uniref:ShlB/FhaC/HecB family hemolysin secretion/activation protein n=1 Tax=uncultured Methylophaga sp. TaxID=285271 RepID=UPI00261AED6A|nr:POTRA domain-containing protein [uncultured Methylophaga sp.]
MQHNLIAALCCSLFIPLAAQAVEPPFIVDESEQQISEPKKQTDVTVPDEKSLSTAPEVKTIKVEEVQFRGGSVFSLDQLAKMVEPLLGRDVTKSEIVTVLRAITTRYKEAGYALSFALLPDQNTSDGVLTIVLVEGYIARQEIVIEDEDVKARVAKLAARMQTEKPLTTATFERYLKLIEATPGYRFKVRVPKPKTYGGGTTIRVESVSSEWIEGTMGLDDSKEEELKLLPGVRLNSLTSHGDRLTATALLPNDSVEAYYALNYQQDLGTDGLRLTLAANHFESEGDDQIFVADIPLDYQENKQRDTLRAGIEYPLQLSRKSAWWLGSRLHYLDEDAVYQLRRIDGLGRPVEIEKTLRYSALEVYSNWTRQFSRQIVRLSGSIKQGLDIGNTKNSIIDANGNRRGSETTHFNFVRLDALWRYMLSSQWRVQSKLNLFWSDDVLPSAEQIRYGGPRYGRGYADGQAQGDKGLAAEIELRYLQPIAMDFIKRIEPYLVIDTARAKLRASDRDQELISAALGVDITDTDSYTLGLEYAKPLGDDHIETEDKSPVYNLRIRWQF